MPKTPLKHKKANGKLPANAVNPKHCLPRNAKSAKLPQVPLAVTPESACMVVHRLHHRQKRRLQICCHHLQILQPHLPRSRLHRLRRRHPLLWRRKQCISISAIALRSRQDFWSTSNPPLISPLIKRLRSHSLWGNSIQALLQQRLLCLLARLPELLRLLSSRCHQRKRIWSKNSYLWSTIPSRW